jgi:hypothetical protein
MGWAGSELSTVLYKERGGGYRAIFCVVFFRFFAFWLGLGA